MIGLIQRDQHATGPDALAGLDVDRRDGTCGGCRHARSTLYSNHSRAGRVLGQRTEYSVRRTRSHHQQKQPVCGGHPFRRNAQDVTTATVTLIVVAQRLSAKELS